jgi:hypothetical protein
MFMGPLKYSRAQKKYVYRFQNRFTGQKKFTNSKDMYSCIIQKINKMIITNNKTN